ncbi:sulfur carrier protein ThiS [Aquimarina gracilis]|uniref:Sulfur carrier protein ThiS n=1 Tax=Aquimarina gracilis TaxID=874422 RepID=A0ABU6A0E9_9FLAO|nr:sulfur carrier protein ThiS [Aquimarina gracilis]MEB3347591.1 sulfur carrier protein ThiS [Aquimarina gracilis]
MTINVNNQPRSISENSSISSMLDQLDTTKNGIAVAINNIVIRKDQWLETVLKENDQVTIIQATQGG